MVHVKLQQQNPASTDMTRTLQNPTEMGRREIQREREGGVKGRERGGAEGRER
jgi:hypothetical protein